MSGWQDKAACKGVDTNLFFPENADVDDQVLALCENCPVKDECRDYGVVYEEWGIWGGLTASQRRRVRKEFGITLSQAVTLRRAPYHANCGTNAGYHGLIRYYEAHPYDKKIKCDYCTLAHKEYKREIILEEDKIIRTRERERRKKARQKARRLEATE
jgi:WhiB family redox-sensing transcriptional regulator